jgi:hypothetical protein
MVQTVDTLVGWLLELGQSLLAEDEIIYLSTKPSEDELCSVFGYLIVILNGRASRSDCFAYPDLEPLKLSTGCPNEIPSPTIPTFFLGVGVDL